MNYYLGSQTVPLMEKSVHLCRIRQTYHGRQLPGASDVQQLYVNELLSKDSDSLAICLNQHCHYCNSHILQLSGSAHAESRTRSISVWERPAKGHFVLDTAMQAAGQRFVSWLYQHIEEDSIPGVVWVNKPQLVCQIPWQRGSRKSYSGGSLTKLLQAWAKYRGRSQEPDLRTCMKEVNYALQNLKGVLRTVKVDEVEGYRLLQFDRTALEKDVHVRLDDTDQSRIGKQKSLLNGFTSLLVALFSY